MIVWMRVVRERIESRMIPSFWLGQLTKPVAGNGYRMRNWSASDDEFISGCVGLDVLGNQSSFSSVLQRVSCTVPVK